MRLTLLILLLAALPVLADNGSRKIGNYFIVSYNSGSNIEGDGLSPDGKLAIVVKTNKNVGLPVPKGDRPSPYNAYLIETDSQKVLWKTPVDGDFTWGPLTSMVTCKWNPNSQGFILRTKQGRLMSMTNLYLHTDSGAWKKVDFQTSEFESSEYFRSLHKHILDAGKKFYEEASPPNVAPPGSRQFIDWSGNDKVIVHESFSGNLIYRFDTKGHLHLIGYDPEKTYVKQ